MSLLLSAMSLRSFNESRDRIFRVLRILTAHQAGRQLIERAQRTWEVQNWDELIGYFKWGSASRTDSTLVRTFYLESGEEKRERKVQVILREDQSDEEVALDLAHELVHALSPSVVDPYDPELTMGSYLLRSIEGEGGEVAAMMSECQLSLEMNQKSAHPRLKRCKRYIDLENHQMSQSEILKDFYHSGSWYEEIRKELGHEALRLPHLSAAEPQFYSSIEGTPYPQALIQEYKQLTQAACHNIQERGQKSSQRFHSQSWVQRKKLIDQRCANHHMEE